jgi:hypothetical protein
MTRLHIEIDHIMAH